MDFEQQLEKAEKLAQPSLVGSSLRLADDSQHNNYIHPEKSVAEKTREFKKKKDLLLNSALGASLDDLINEGALLGDESSFDKYLDNLGHIKDEALASEDPEVVEANSNSNSNTKSSNSTSIDGESGDVSTKKNLSTAQDFNDKHDDATSAIQEDQETPGTATTAAPASGIVNASNASNDPGSTLYSTPNLSEYQLENQIKDHNDLLSLVQSINPLRLPARHDYPRENAKELAKHSRTPSNQTPTPSSLVESPESSSLFSALHVKDQIHVPYLQRDGRSSSRSRGPPPRTDRSRSRSSSAQPHLARGDSYKNTVTVVDPKQYERPDAVDEMAEEGNDRRSRASRPTMGATIAAAERAQALNNSLRSLLTTGDYTNFNVDQAGPQLTDDLYSARSESSYNYLRSISRSRLRQPGEKGLILRDKRSSLLNEKYDADTTELKSEGALVSDDPYDSINNLSTMVEEVLHHKGEDGEQLKNQSKNFKESEKPVKESEREEDEEEIKKQNEKGGETGGTGETGETGPSKSKESEDIHETESPLVVSTKEVRKVDTEGSEDAEDPEEANETEPLFSNNAKETEPLFSKDVEENEPLKSEDTEEAEPSKSEDKEETEPLFSRKVEETKLSKSEVSNDDEEIEPSDVAKIDPLKAEDAEENEPTDVETAEIVETVDSKASGVVHETDDLVEVEKPIVKDVEEETDGKAEITAKGISVEPKTTETESDVFEALKPEIEPLDTSKQSTSEASEPSAPQSKLIVEESANSVPVTKSVPVVADDESDLDEVSPEEIRKHLEAQPVYIFTSLAGGMQITHRTNKLAMILKANQVEFTARDLGTDEEAKKIWRRYLNGKTLPGVVRGDDYIGNWEQIEEANEEYRVRELVYETL